MSGTLRKDRQVCGKHRRRNAEQMYRTAQAMGGQLQWQVRNRTVYRFRTVFIRIRRSGARRNKGRCRRASLSWKAESVTCRNDWRGVSRLEHTHLKIHCDMNEKSAEVIKNLLPLHFFDSFLFCFTISKIRKLKSVFDGLKFNSRRFSAKIKD